MSLRKCVGEAQLENGRRIERVSQSRKQVLVLAKKRTDEAASEDRALLDALAFVREHQHSTGRLDSQG